MSEKDSHDKINPAVNRRNYLKLASMAGTGLGTGIGAGSIGTEFSTPVRAATTVVDDFTYSSGGLSDRYEFAQDGGNATVTSASTVGSNDDDANVLEVSGGNSVLHAFEGDGDTDLNAYPNIGETFSCWIRGVDGTGIMNFNYGAQDKDNKYYVQLNLDSAHLGLFKYESGSGQSLAGDWSNSTIEGNSGWFKIEIQWTTDHTHTVTLYQNGSQVTSFSYTEDSDDPRYTATGVGYSAYLSSGETAQFDYATTTGSSDSGGSTSVYKQSHVDDFEVADQKLNAYDFERGKSGATIAANTESSGSEETYSGKQSLKISDSSATEMISLPGEGLEDYPEAGDAFVCYVKATGGADNFNFSWGVQGHSDRYYVKVKPTSGAMYLFKYKNNDGTVLDSTSGMSISQDEWYYLEVVWDTDGTQTVELYDLNGKELGKCSGNDSEWTSGGIGFDAYLNSGEAVYFDDVAIVEEAGPYKGGWGPVHQPSPAEIPTSAPTGDGQWWDVDDLHFYLTYAGVDDGDGEVTHNFQVAGNLHTYKRKESFKDNQESDELYPRTLQQSTKVRAEITDNTQGASVTSGDDANTWAYALNETEWERWKSSGSFDDDYGFNEFKAAAIQNGPLSDDSSDFTAKALSFAFSTGIGLTGPGGEIVDLAINTIGFLDDLARDPEPNCDIDVDDDVPDVEFTEWNWCDEVGLTMCTRSLEVDVEKGTEPATLVVEHEVLPESELNAENVCTWEITCPDTLENATWDVSLRSGSI